jgi:hypothetical protein
MGGGALRVHFQNFAANSKKFEIFPADFKKIGRKLMRSAPYMYTRSAPGGALWVSLKFQKKIELCSRPTYP